MRTRLRRFDPILIQAVIAAALSFSHIHDIAAAAGQGGWKAWAYPVSLDLLLAVAWRRIRSGAGGASLGANVLTAGTLDLHNVPVALRVMIAGWPAVAFLSGTQLVHSRRSHNADGDEPNHVPNAPATGAVEPDADGDEPDADAPAVAPSGPVL